MLRTLALIPLALLVLAAPAAADPHREQIPIESWSPPPASAAGGTGKTMTAALLGKR